MRSSSASKLKEDWKTIIQRNISCYTFMFKLFIFYLKPFLKIYENTILHGWYRWWHDTLYDCTPRYDEKQAILKGIVNILCWLLAKINVLIYLYCICSVKLEPPPSSRLGMKCAYGICKSESRYLKSFFPFPKPITQQEHSLIWV